MCAFIVPFLIAKLGQKCLEAVPTLKYGPLHSCLTVYQRLNHKDISMLCL